MQSYVAHVCFSWMLHLLPIERFQLHEEFSTSRDKTTFQYDPTVGENMLGNATRNLLKVT